MAEPQRQVNFQMPLSHWKALRAEAARRGCSVGQLLREWLQGPMEALGCKPAEALKENSFRRFRV